MDGDKVHATVDFHHVGIVEDRHAFPHMFLRNTVMVLAQRYVGVPADCHQLFLFHDVAFLWKRAEVALLTAQEHLLA